MSWLTRVKNLGWPSHALTWTPKSHGYSTTATLFPYEIWGSPKIRRQVKEVDHLELRIYQIYEKDKQQIQIYSYIFSMNGCNWLWAGWHVKTSFFQYPETEKILIKKKEESFHGALN